MAPVKPPPGLGKEGRRLWLALARELDRAGLEPDVREKEVLAQAAREVDLIASLQAALDASAAVVPTAGGGVRCHPAVPELRQHRIAFERLLGSLQLPDEAGVPRTTANAAKARAADARWSRFAGRRGVAGGAG